MAAAAKVLSPKQVDVRWTVSVLVLAELAGNHRQCIRRHDRTKTDTRASLSGTQRAARPATSAADDTVNTYVYFTTKVDMTENIKYNIKYKNKMQTTDY